MLERSVRAEKGKGDAMHADASNTKDILTRLSPVFSTCAIECVKALFGHQTEIHMPWQVVAQLQGQFDCILTVGSASHEYSAITCAGIQYDSLKSFVDEEDIPTEYASDILGEFVNVYTGILADKREFREQFGFLTQAVPILYTDGHSFLPFIWGIQGYLYKGEHWLYVGYSIRKTIDVDAPSRESVV